MNEQTTSPAHGTADQVVRVVLVGGPDDLPEALRYHTVAAGQDKIKVHHRGGYEHFERDDAAANHRTPTYHWTTRTKVAE